MEIISALNGGSVTIRVKPNSKKSEVINYDENKKCWNVNIAAPAKDNKANIEVINFFSKLIGKPVRILKGITNREKVIVIKN